MQSGQADPLARGISRRTALTLVLATGALGLAAACGAPAAPSPTGGPPPSASTAPAAAKQLFDWKKYTGETIRVMADKNGLGDAIEGKNAAFTDATGVKVTFELLPEDQFRQKTVVELTSGSGSIDAFMTLIGQEGLKFLKAGWYAPLKPFIDNPALTTPSWDFPDFTEAAIKSQTVSGAGVEPTLVGIPLSLDTQSLDVNKELLGAKNVAVPKTFDELEQAAKTLNDRGQNMFGITLRGKRAAAVSMFAAFLYGFGGRWLDDKGEPAINTPEAIQAFDFYGHLLREYGPPGSENYHFYEATGIFMEGRAAMIADAHTFRQFYEDPTKSKVLGKVGYNPMPKGPAGEFPIVYGWGMAVSNQSKKKEPAWLYTQWMTSKEQALDFHIQFGQPSGRQSVWDSERAKKEAPFSQDWVDTFVYQQKVGHPNWVPPVVPVSEVRDVIGDVIVTAIEGGDAKAAADRGAEQFREIVKRAG